MHSHISMLDRRSRHILKSWYPVGALVLLLLGSYAVFVVLLCIVNLIVRGWSVGLGIVFLSTYHVLLGMVIWSMIQTIRTAPGSPKELYSIHNPGDTVGEHRLYPFPYTSCILCKFPKPYRSAHCQTCNTCHLKMDHRCPWLNSCIGFYNYKYFYLFMFYIVLLGNFVAISLIIEGSYMLKRISDPQGYRDASGFDLGAYPYVFVIYGGIVLLIISTGTFVLVYHTYLISYNKTTIENIREADKSCYNRCLNRRPSHTPLYDPALYDIGLSRNWKSVMGSSYFFWPLPIRSVPKSSDFDLEASSTVLPGFMFPFDQAHPDSKLLTNKG